MCRKRNLTCDRLVQVGYRGTPIRKRMIQVVHLAKAITYVAGAAAICAAISVGLREYDPNAVKDLPSGRDSQLRGDWFAERFGQLRRYRFNEDGTGEIWSAGSFFRSFSWGTEANHVRVKYRGQNSWQAPLLSYEMDGSNAVHLEYIDGTGGFPTELKRSAPDTAKIP